MTTTRHFQDTDQLLLGVVSAPYSRFMLLVLAEGAHISQSNLIGHGHAGVSAFERRVLRRSELAVNHLQVLERHRRVI